MKEKILQLFRDLYCKEYTGKLKIEEIPDGYTLVLGMNQEEKPIRISAQATEDEFLELVKKELLSRHLEMVEYYYGYKIYPINDEFL